MKNLRISEEQRYFVKRLRKLEHALNIKLADVYAKHGIQKALALLRTLERLLL